MKRGFPQKIEPLLPQSLGKDALDALMELAAASSTGRVPSADVLDQVRRLNADDIASVVREAGGEDWVERYLKPILLSADCQRRLKTSAAVMGLALSMGASDILSLMRNQALAAEASEVAESERAEELALELQKLAESAATAVEEGDAVNFSPIAEPPSSSASVQRTVAVAFPQSESPASYHVVQPGETVSSLARSYSVAPSQIVSINRLANASSLKVGQTLQIPGESVQQVSVLPEASAVKLPLEGETSVELSQLKPYQVKQGDTLASIARSYDVSRADLIAVNQLENPNVLKVDQVIALPSNASASASAAAVSVTDLDSSSALPTPPSIVGAVSSDVAPLSEPEVNLAAPAAELGNYRVQPGDTLAKIARKNGVSISELSRANKISNPNFIFVGQSLTIPGGSVNQTGVKPSPSLQGPDVVAARTAESLKQPSETALDPSRYVDGLMGEIRQLRQKYQSPEEIAADLRNPLVPQPMREEVAETVTKPNQAAKSQAVASKPNRYLESLESELRQIRNRARNDVGTTSSSVAKQPSSEKGSSISVQLPQAKPAPGNVVGKEVAQEVQPTPQKEPQIVAAASLGSQSYEPLAQSLLSRSVAPELPPLLSDPYLPKDVLKGYIWPAKGVLSSGYGWRWGRMHKGIDIAGPVGTPIVAAGGGVVTYAGWNSGGYGNLVEITHADGSVSLYAHNSRITVREGQRVRQGQQIAAMGSTGNSTGPHLHFEIHSPGKGAVNPVSLLPAKN